jgi:hypothetical protein
MSPISPRKSVKKTRKSVKRSRRKSVKRSRRKSVKRSRRKSIKKTSRKSVKRSRRKSVKRSGKLKLIKIVKSPISGKKLRAYFSDGTHTDFGATGYSDYTKHKDDERKKRYIDRHRKRENWKNPKSAGALSLYILWNKKSLKASISDYKKRFNL